MRSLIFAVLSALARLRSRRRGCMRRSTQSRRGERHCQKSNASDAGAPPGHGNGRCPADIRRDGLAAWRPPSSLQFVVRLGPEHFHDVRQLKLAS